MADNQKKLMSKIENISIAMPRHDDTTLILELRERCPRNPEPIPNPNPNPNLNPK
jgi:hypothetical protein